MRFCWRRSAREATRTATPVLDNEPILMPADEFPMGSDRGEDNQCPQRCASTQWLVLDLSGDRAAGGTVPRGAEGPATAPAEQDVAQILRKNAELRAKLAALLVEIRQQDAARGSLRQHHDWLQQQFALAAASFMRAMTSGLSADRDAASPESPVAD